MREKEIQGVLRRTSPWERPQSYSPIPEKNPSKSPHRDTFKEDIAFGTQFLRKFLYEDIKEN